MFVLISNIFVNLQQLNNQISRKMIQLSKEQEPFYLQLKEIQKEMKQAAEQSKVYQNSLIILSRTIKKNELTVKQLEKVPAERAVYVPLGKAFLKRNKDQTIKQISSASAKLQQSCKDMQNNQKVFADKANEKYKLLKEGMQKLTKKQ